jgi:hypothetical protein
LRTHTEGTIWDKKKKQFVYDTEALRREEKRLGIKGTVKVTVGEKVYIV